MRVCRHCVGGELVWVHGLDPGVHEHSCCAESSPTIVGDDGVGLTDNRGVGDVAVIGIVEPVAVLSVFGCSDLRAWKRLLQLIEKVLSATGAIADPALVVQTGEYVDQLEENPGPPNGRVRLLSSQLQQEVALKARHKGTGVENSAIHVGESLRLRGRSTLTFRLGEQLGDLVGVGIRELRRALGDEPVAPSVKLLAVGKDIGKPQLASDRAGHVGV